MINKRIYLADNNPNVYIDTYISDPIEGLTRDALLVIPGGGYGAVCSQREGEPIAMAFIPFGYNAFVLHYSVSSDIGYAGYPTQLIEASAAIAHIREHANEYNINPDRIFACGFSAGGHLCASLGTMWHRTEVNESLNIPFGYNKPTGVMLIYPVISTRHHGFSFNHLLGTENPTDKMLQYVSVENYVDERSAPAFIVHTSNDQTVDVRNSLAVANAYVDFKLQFELHIYPDAPHGVALGNKITACSNSRWENESISKWVENAVLWANSID